MGSSANLKTNVDMANEGIHTKGEALLNIDPDSLVRFLHPTIDPKAKVDVLATGLAASPGAASGQIVFSSKEAETIYNTEGLPLILVREETIPEDVHGMGAANGILTVRGGMSSHAAVIARGMGKPCVCGVSSAIVDMENNTLKIGGRLLKSGEIITIDGTNGQIFAGEVAKRQPKLSGDFATLMQWADEIRRMRVRCNAETPNDCKAALEFGAEGIGLCRTEHMFFDEQRIMVMREMILSNDEEKRREVLERLLPMQRSDFEQLFELMPGLPVTIRLLDPPLHEFLPKGDEEIIRISEAMGIEEERLRTRVNTLNEANPMLGHRGCRLAISHPEITEMQARAIFEAAVASAKKTGKPVVPEIMVPLVSMREELEYIKQRIDWVAQDVMRESSSTIDYLVGSMIELPRAAIRARNIAEFSEFFSFGTNDLTQTTFGFSRDDAASFLPTYQKKNILPHDPFASIDFLGVGELIEMASQRGRETRPDIKLGICGEHGGDPASIEFCDAQGLEYVSCSPYRVPIARLSAAQATLRNKML
jgi:pyruvate,orthophosphate dikinase